MLSSPFSDSAATLARREVLAHLDKERTTSEQRGNNLHRLKDFNRKANATSCLDRLMYRRLASREQVVNLDRKRRGEGAHKRFSGL